MRLRRLDLTRYGKFTGQRVDFGPKPSSGPDLHIVFGLNEAGKSTAMSAYLDLLYGIEERSRYAFLHEYASMRVGGILELDGTEKEFIRIKQRANSLLDAAGQPVPEAALGAHLAGLARDAYGTMFSLDDETLEAGGKAILESKGDLGQLLFAAGAGLAHASDALTTLETEADTLYRKHAQGTELAKLKKRLADLKAERDAIDTLASTYEALEGERADAAAGYDRIVSERSVLQARLDTIARFARAVPMLVDIGRKAARLAEMPDIVSPPTELRGAVAELIRDDATSGARMAGNSDDLARLTERIGLIEVDQSILDVSERVLALAERKIRHVSAGLDLPARTTDLSILDQTVASCLAALGRTGDPDPAALLLPAATVGAVRNMVEQRSGIATGLRVARDEAADAADALQAARERIGEERAVGAPVRARLASALTKARDSGNAREQREARVALDETTASWQAAHARLYPWAGEAEALARIQLPSSGQIGAWKADVTRSRTQAAVLEGRLAEHERARDSLAERLAALRASVEMADDETARTIRSSRDRTWELHRNELDEETADAFAAVLAKDDASGAARLANARHLEELRNAIAMLADTEATLESTRSAIAACEAEMGSLAGTIRLAAGELAGGLGTLSPPQRELEHLEERVEARAAALVAWREMETVGRRVTSAAGEGEELRRGLFGAGERVGLSLDAGDGMDAAMAVAELFLDRQAKLDAELAETKKTIQTKEDDLASRRRAVEAAERRDEEWLDGLKEALAGTWLAGGLSASGVGSVLDQLATLSKALQDRDAMRLRVDKMEGDRRGFLAEVAAVAVEAGEPVDAGEPEQAATRLSERLEHAARSKEAKASLEGDVARLQEAREVLASELSAHEARKASVLRVFGVATLAEVAEREELLRERDRLLAAIAELEAQLSHELGAGDGQAARATLDGIDIDDLAIEKADIEQRLVDLDELLGQQLVRQTRAADKLEAIGSDSAVARIDGQRRTALLEIEETATRYIRLKLGTMAAGNALREYRERHRSAMMQRASDAFRMMTRGMYTGLSSQPTKGGEVLIASQQDGRSKVADALSKGTRFQLYLALRLAGYHEFAKLRPTVPFVADDILETFDHFRSEEVFKLFGEMARVGQVIYLTHHRHLCDIAKAAVPGAVVHELG